MNIIDKGTYINCKRSTFVHNAVAGIREVEVQESNNIMTRAVSEYQVHKFAFKYIFVENQFISMVLKPLDFIEYVCLKNHKLSKYNSGHFRSHLKMKPSISSKRY